MFEKRRAINWKYSQAKIMIEFFRDDIPKPFSILNILPIFVRALRNFFKNICKRVCNPFKDDTESAVRRHERCFGENTNERVKHADLMQTLISRLKVL